MAQIKRLGRPSKERNAVTRNQATDLLWKGKIETTDAKAKALRGYVEKIITKAMNTYEDTVKGQKNAVDDKGNKIATEVINDGSKKLAARRWIMNKLYKVKEPRLKGETKQAFTARTESIKNPLLEKIFNVYAPKYAARAKELGQGGGYTRIVKFGTRRGDAANIVLIELI